MKVLLSKMENIKIVYLGGKKNGEMMFVIHSKSKIDKRNVMMYINENGGGFACNN